MIVRARSNGAYAYRPVSEGLVLLAHPRHLLGPGPKG